MGRVSSPRLALLRTRRWASGLAGAVRRRDWTSTVAVTHNAIGTGSFARLATRMSDSDDGRRLLREQPRIHVATFDQAVLEALPDGTLGREFVRHMKNNGFIRDIDLPADPLGEDHPAVYARARWRETHDFRHVVTGLGASMPDEAVIGAFQLAQVFNPWSAIVCVVGPVLGARACNPLVTWWRMPEAFRAGRACAPLASVRWEDLLAEPVSSLRDRFGVRDLSHLSVW